MSDRVDFEELAHRISSNDESAVKEFFNHFRPRLMIVANRRGVPTADCEDVAELGLSAAIDQLRRGLFRGDAPVAAWVYRIMLGKVNDYFRKHLIEIKGSEGLDAVELSPLDSFPAELVLTVRQILAELPEEYRMLLTRRFQEGASGKELAAESGEPLGTLNRKVHEAKKLFADRFLNRRKHSRVPTYLRETPKKQRNSE